MFFFPSVNPSKPSVRYPCGMMALNRITERNNFSGEVFDHFLISWVTFTSIELTLAEAIVTCTHTGGWSLWAHVAGFWVVWACTKICEVYTALTFCNKPLPTTGRFIYACWGCSCLVNVALRWAEVPLHFSCLQGRSTTACTGCACDTQVPGHL